jgi:uncharacterized SAM-binding protein YcdF (DUF218 family)
MKKRQWKKKPPAWMSVCLALSVLFGSAVLGLQSPEARKLLREALVRQLTRTERLPPHPAGAGEISGNAIYILGGSRMSLEGRFRTAAELYRQGAGSKILLLNEVWMMEYFPPIGRNLTYEEWVVKKLSDFGVRVEDVELVSLPVGFFGTLSEAKAIPPIVSGRGYSTLVLVTSHYHTRRTWASFVRFTEDLGLDLYIYPADEKVGLRQVVPELLKLVFYEVFLV